MNTEITDTGKYQGWVLYDGDCRLCVRWARRVRGLLARRGFELLPLQTSWVRSRLGTDDLLTEMRLLRPDGRVVGGADALVELSRYYWWAWPLRQIARIPGGMEMLRHGYQWIARRRNCSSGACDVSQTLGISVVAPLVVLPLLALLLRVWLAPWAFMWATAFALYAGCKWLSLAAAIGRGARPEMGRILGYLLAWPGMDATAFFDVRNIPEKPRMVEWIFAALKVVFGSVLLWGIARLAFPVHPLFAGWIGMVGVIFTLHFGWFHLASLGWRRAGIAAKPLMHNPLAARSLGDFWGRRWNTPFNELAFRFTFLPLCRRTTPAIATLFVFFLSGLVHELVISVPARGGYGLPTLYFVIQGIGMVAERRWGGGRKNQPSVIGWIFTMAVTAGPAFWLFHPQFVRNVILPMLHAIGAI